MPSWQCNVFNMLARASMKHSLRTVMNLEGSLKAMKRVKRTLRPTQEFEHGGHRFQAQWVEPGTGSSQRAILYLPGGGFIAPPTERHLAMVSRLCEQADARALVVHYRLLPEHPFPAALEDSLAAYRYLLESGIGAADIAIAGDSAGGCLAFSTLFSLRDAGEALPAACAVLSPLTDLTFTGKSRVRNRYRDPLLAAREPELINRVLLPKGMKPDHPIACPLYGDFSGLPPVLAQVGSTEILLDDVLRVAPRARAQAVDFHVEVWPGAPHVFQLFEWLPEAREAIGRLAAFFERQWNADQATVLRRTLAAR
jgi:monoterpene epsilon-lactone hydrolase